MRVLYASFSYNEQWRIAKNLQMKHGWEPVYWMSSTEVKNEVESAFPGIVFQDYIAARRAVHSNDLKDIKDPVVDKVLLDALSVHQIDAMRIIYRCDSNGTNFTFFDLIEHYYDQIRFWLKVIVELKIELFVNWVNPHSSEYVLYLLCKHLKIPILYTDAAYLITEDTHLICNSIEDKTSFLRKKIQDITIETGLSEKIKNKLDIQRSTYDKAIPSFMSDPWLFGEKGFSLRRTLLRIKEFIHAVAMNTKPSSSHFKLRPGPYKDIKTGGTYWDLFWFTRFMNKIGSQYEKIYSKFVADVNYNCPYVYFAAPFQPESATLPDAGVYVDVLLILTMISDAIPEDWIIYYKEHPATFDSKMMGGHLYRSAEFYKKVSKIPKVKMIYHRTDSFKLIDHSVLVASATGTVGWEAVVRGKASLAFGQSWYLPCEGVFLIKSSEDLENVIKKVRSGYSPSKEGVERFAGIVDKYCFKGFKLYSFGTRYNEMSSIEEEMNRYSEFFLQAYRNYYGGLEANEQKI